VADNDTKTWLVDNGSPIQAPAIRREN
jgi:hypothetical protein